MIVILCIDDNNGMMFNHRRQSKDRILLEDVIAYSKENRLYLNEYSYKLFSGMGTENIIVDPEFLDRAGTGEYCFVEDRSLLSYEQKIEKLIIYKWNRRYPADLYLDISLGEPWKIADTKEFKGYSHEKITKEIYIK
ncbi:MAG TPA: ribonuclease Z [Clostridiales bacterium]|nr:ribonuclease Z [Clostridiales bacterium]